MNTELGSILQELSAKLQVTTEQLWDVMIMQSRIDAIVISLAVLLFVLVSLVFLWQYKKASEDYDNVNKELNAKDITDKQFIKRKELRSKAECMLAFAGISAGLGLVLLLINGNDIIMGFFNPEYGALKEILKALQ